MCARASHVRRPASTSASDVEPVEPFGLGSIRHEREAGRPRRVQELLAHDIGGDVLRARRLERRAAPLVGPVRPQPVAGAAFEDPPRHRRRSRSRTSVPRRSTRPQAANHASIPRGIGSRAPGRHRMPFGDRVECEGIAGFGRHEHFGEPAGGRERDPNLRPTAARSHSATPNGRLSRSSLASTTPGELERRQLVERDEHRAGARDRGRCVVGRLLRERAQRLVGRLELEPLALLVAQRGRTLHQHVVQRAHGNRDAARNTSRGEPAVARAGLDDHERIGIAQLVPTIGRAPAPRTRRTASRPRGSSRSRGRRGRRRDPTRRSRPRARRAPPRRTGRT